MSKVDKMMSRPLGQETPKAHPCKWKSHCTTSNSGTTNPPGAQILLQWEPEGGSGRLPKTGLLLPDLLARVKQRKWHQTRPARRLQWFPLSHSYSPESRRGKGYVSTLSERRRLEPESPCRPLSRRVITHFLLAACDEGWPANQYWLCPGKLIPNSAAALDSAEMALRSLTTWMKLTWPGRRPRPRPEPEHPEGDAPERALDCSAPCLFSPLLCSLYSISEGTQQCLAEIIFRT